MAEYCLKIGRIPPKSEWLAAMHLVYLVQETVTLEDIYSFVKGIKECDVSRSNSDCHFIHLFLKTAIWKILL